MSKLEQAKDAILANIIRAANDDTESVESVKHLVEAYSIIVGAETQEKMTIWTMGDNFEDDDLDDALIWRATQEDRKDMDEKIKYNFTRHSSYAASATMDQDGKLVERDASVNWWMALKCVVTLKHFGGGIWQSSDGWWRCKRCNRCIFQG